MSELERRALMGVAGIGALAALAKAGPLTPPAGAVAPTGRTLDEVYNRIPADGAGQGRTPLVPGTATISINSPGAYILTGPLTRAGTCMQINVSDVDVDLNGHTLHTTVTGSSSTLAVATAATNVRVHNGALRGGLRCAAVGSNCHGACLEKLDAYGGKNAGIFLAAGSIGIRIQDCRIFDTGSTTVAADPSLSVIGIDCSSTPGLRVSNCQIMRLFYNGSGTANFRGISCSGVGTLVENCQVMHDSAITGTAYFMVNALYKNNLATNFSAGYSNGTSGGGNF
jgi:hypothetical protein